MGILGWVVIGLLGGLAARAVIPEEDGVASSSRSSSER